MPNEDDRPIIEAFKQMPYWQKLEHLKNCVGEVHDLSYALEVRTRRILVMSRLLQEEAESTYEITSLFGGREEVKG